MPCFEYEKPVLIYSQMIAQGVAHQCFQDILLYLSLRVPSNLLECYMREAVLNDLRLGGVVQPNLLDDVWVERFK